MDEPTKPSVLLADDDSAFRKALEMFLEPWCHVVASVADGRALVTEAQALTPDLIIADVSMPLLNGIQATQRLRAAQPKARVILLTVHEESAFLREALRSGALGYVLKRTAANDLLPAIHEVLQERPFVSPSIQAPPLDSPPTEPPTGKGSRQVNPLRKNTSGN
jgi:DNA-binding NarL/FixJ family response regulator